MRATKFVESYFDAWNHRDPEEIADHLAPDGIYCDVPENVQRSHDELVTNLKEFFRTYRHRYELIGEILTNGNTVAFQYEMVPPDNGSNPESRTFFRGAEFVTLGEDEALSIIDYCNIPDEMPAGGVTRMSSEEAERRKYAKSGLNDDQLRSYRARLEQVMHE